MLNAEPAFLKKTGTNLLFLGFGLFCLVIALAIAWVLGITLFFPHGELAGQLVERADIIRAHVDYLLMAQFLILFFLLFRQLAMEPPLWVVLACCFGAFFNPLAFLRRGLAPKPDPALLATMEPHFPFMAGLSFTLTTVGFLSAVGMVLWESYRRSCRN